MSLRNISPGKHLPHEVNVIIEIPSQSDPVKYEVDKDTNVMCVDRIMSTSMRYPVNYGYVPQTLYQDGDPIDVLLLCPFSLMSGSVIRCRVIGILNMVDDSGPDSKLLVVPVNSITPLYKKVHSPKDVSPVELNAIKHFFEHYKDLEPGKWVEIKGWSGPDKAKKDLMDSIERFKKNNLKK